MSSPEARTGLTSSPSGSGNVPGLGEAFTINLNTGQGVYSYKLPLPDGRAGHGARLTLEYAHGCALGPFGLGWRLPVRAIVRRLDFGVPEPGVAERLLDGGQELVETPDGSFAAAQESAFTRYRRSADGWLIEDRNGVVHECGLTPGGRVAHPDHPERVQEWLLERSLDACGNVVGYQYERDGGVAYLSRVRWAAYELRFTYEERPDTRDDARAGFLRTMARRCARIELFMDPGASERRVRSWEFTYAVEPVCGVSLLTAIAMTSHGAASDGSQDVRRAPVRFGYSAFDPAAPAVRFMDVPAGPEPPSLDTPDTALVVLDRAPLPGVLQVRSGLQYYWPNGGDGRWGHARRVADTPDIDSFGEAGVLLADADGSGTADMIVAGPQPLHGYYENGGGAGWSRFVAYPRARAAAPPWNSGRVRLTDADGDGIVDAIASSGRAFTVWRNGGPAGWSTPLNRPRENGAGPAGVDFADERVHLADMNGDGIADLVRVGSGRVEYWPGLGHGRFGARVVMTGSPRLPGLVDDPRGVVLIDVDGDGCADLVRVSARGVQVAMNRNGRALAPLVTVRHAPPPLPGTLRAVNMNGRAGAGLVWCSLRRGSPGYVQLEFAPAGPPYVLTSVDNGSGLRSELRYRPAVEDYLRDADQGDRWTTSLTFPLTVVAGTRELDTVSGQEVEVEYRYHDGHFDPRTRQFQGFGRTERIERGDESRADTLTVFHFLMAQERVPGNGPDHVALNGRLARTEVYALDGSPDEDLPYRVEECDYELRLLATAPHAARGRGFVSVTAHRAEDRDRTDDVRGEEKTYSYDGQGNVIRELLRGYGTRGGMAQPERVRVTEITYATAAARHLIDKPARIVERDGAGAIVREKRHYYDGSDFVGLPFGQVDRGLLTREEHLVLSGTAFAAHYTGMTASALGYHTGTDADGTPSIFTNRERYAYDARGLRRARRDPLGRDESYEHDPDGLFRTLLRDSFGETRYTYDRASGQPVRIKYADGSVTRFEYDAQGRVTGSLLPGDDPAAPPRTFSYDDLSVPNSRSARFRPSAAPGDAGAAVTYFDGHGREFQQRVGAGGGRVVVSGLSQRNPWGDVKREFEPSEASTLAFALPATTNRPQRVMRYDGRGRVVETVDYGGGVSRAGYRPFEVVLHDPNDTGASATPRREEFDVFRDRTRIVQELGGGATATTRYEVGPAGDLLAVRDDSGTLCTHEYDRMGRRLVADHREGGRRRLFYDARGNTVRSIDAKGNDVTAEIDAQGRLMRLRLGGTVVERYTYDDPGRNALGRLASVTYRGGRQDFSYDRAGRLLRHEYRFDGAARAETLTYEYDDLGREVGLTHTDGRRIAKQLTPNGWVRAIPGILDEVAYDARGLPVRMRYANGVVTDISYTAGPGRVRTQRTVGPGGRVLHDVTLDHDELGLLVRKEDAAPGGQAAQGFDYDPMQQLRRVTRAGAAPLDYAYDRQYNLSELADTGAALDYDDPARPYRLTGVTPRGGAQQTLVYDANGNLTRRGRRRFAYDYKNALAHFEDGRGLVADYRYDARGVRISKVVDDHGSVSRTLFVGEEAEVRDGRPTLFVRLGELRVAIIRSGRTRFVHSDYLGNTAFFSDAGGAKIAAISYLPFGNVAGSNGAIDLRTYGGHPFDTESGLYYMQRRHYDPRTARFLQPDPVAVLQPHRYVGNQRAMHPYAYVGNDPMNNADPDGLSFWSVVGAIVGVIVAVAIAVVAVIASPIIAIALVIGLVIVSYIVADATQGTGFGEFMRGFMIGLNAGLNMVLATALFGPGVGIALGVINFLAAFDGIASSPVYQGILGWSSWLMPMSWLATGVGLIFFVVNLLVAGVTFNSWAPARINSISIDWATGTIVTHGGLLTPVPGGYNLGNFAYIHRNTTLDPGLVQHETGHTLNVAAFGAIFHYVGAIDENVVPGRGSAAYAELLADSHDTTPANLTATPGDWFEMWV